MRVLRRKRSVSLSSLRQMSAIVASGCARNVSTETRGEGEARERARKPAAYMLFRCITSFLYVDSPRRMKQLEQRVESLMGMLSGNPQSLDLPPQTNELDSTPAVHHAVPAQTSTSKMYATPEDSASRSSGNEFAAWDPVDVGFLEAHQAVAMLNEFRKDFVNTFPFVVVEPSISADTLRLEHPFLFLSIMTAMAYRTPGTQNMLAQEFREQIAARIAGCTHKGLEFLQGLLIHAAYYHFVYETGKQQLALVTQLCVAASQDIGLPKKYKDCDLANLAPGSSTAEPRALLGTYYVAAAWVTLRLVRLTIHGAN
jgi:hypothetical protein